MNDTKDIKFANSAEFAYTWKNRGRLLSDPEKKLSMTDALSVPDARTFFPQVIDLLIREAIEPLMVVNSLMNVIPFIPGQLITLPNIGAVGVADMIPEGGEYPEMSLATGAGVKITTSGKYGIAFKMTEEMVKYSQWDVFNLALRAATHDMARLKEVNAVNMLLNEGVVAFDNVSPGSSIKGVTTGRKADGSGNGSATMDDIFDAYGIGLENGFKLDTILVHPLTWIMWVKDPVLRAFAVQSGGGTFFAGWNGSVNQANAWTNGPLGELGPAGQTARTTSGGTPDYVPTRDSAPVLPNYLGVPFRIIVSPFVPYNPSTRLANIIMLASGQAGALLVEENLTMQEIPDLLRDMKKVKMRERYIHAPLNEGYGIVTLKNVHVVQNFIVNYGMVYNTNAITIEDLSAAPNVLD